MSKPVILYISPYDILRPRTNQVSDVRFCEGFAQNECEVHLIVPFVKRPDNIAKSAIENTYGLEKTIAIHFLKTAFTSDVSGKFRLALVGVLSTFKVFALLRKLKGRKVVIISRNAPLLKPILTFFKGRKQVSIIHWAHEYKSRPSYHQIYKACDGILATNSSITKDLCKGTGISSANTCVTGNPITEEQVRSVQSREQSRKAIGLDTLQKPLVVYTGKLAIDYNQELRHILEAAQALPQYQFLLTGGKPIAVDYWENWCSERQVSNVIFTGYLPDYSKIRLYQQAADVLVSYYTHQGHDVRYNLPNKLCEYMLSGNVIVTPDFPATIDLLNNNNCYFVKAEDSSALAAGIKSAIEQPEESVKKAEQAAKDVREITFRKKTAQVLEFLAKRHDQ